MCIVSPASNDCWKKKSAADQMILIGCAFEWCWTTRIRTGNDRTKTCSVTITPSSNTFAVCGCKGMKKIAFCKIFYLWIAVLLSDYPFCIPKNPQLVLRKRRTSRPKQELVQRKRRTWAQRTHYKNSKKVRFICRKRSSGMSRRH